MGWRDVQAKVASGELDYRRPGKSGFDFFAEGFANSFSETMRATRAEEAEERRYARNRADKLADEERLAAVEAEKDRKRKLEERLKEAAEQEKKDAARQRNARKLLQENGRDPNNPNFLGFAMDHLEAYGDSFADANSAFAELNKRITEVGPVQGPLLTREREGYDQATPEEQAQMDNILGVGDTSGVREALRANESGGRTDVVDFNKEDGKDHVGLYQFGQGRLDDYNKANGTSITTEQLKEMSAEEQEKIADWHFDDIDAYIDSNNLEKYVGQTIGGVTITRSSMIAMAHLGGKSGMKQFLETDGKYDPSDGATKLSDYARDFAAEDPTTSPAGGVGEATEEQMSAAFEIAPPTVNTGAKKSEYLKDLNSVNEIIGRKTMVANDPKLSALEKADIEDELNRTMNEMLEQKEKEAQRNTDPMLFIPLDENGLAIPGRAVYGRRVDGGIEQEDGTVVEGNYKFVTQEFAKDFVKFNNDNVEQIADYQASAANLARDLVDLKGIVLANPAITNRFAIAATDITSFLREGASTFSAFMSPDKQYSYDQALTALEASNLAPERKKSEMLKLRIAYGLARLEGSSGMSLSDKELNAQLETVLSSGDPKKALDLIDTQLRSLIERAETTRSTKVDGFLGIGADANSLFPNAKWNMPMEDYVRGELGEERIAEFERSLDPSTEYDLSGTTVVEDPEEKDELDIPQLEDWMNGKAEIKGLKSLGIYQSVIKANPNLAEGMLNSAFEDFKTAGIDISKQELASILGVTIDE